MNLDPNIYKNNYAALQERYPELALMLTLIEVKYPLFQMDGCMPNVMYDGQPYYVGNLIQYCEESFKGGELENVKVPVFCGAGLGYEILYWMQYESPKHKSQAIIIIERDIELFQCAMNTTDLRPIITNPNIHLFVGVQLQNLYTILRKHFTEYLPELLMSGAMQPVFLYPPMRTGRQYYMSALQILFEAAYHSLQNFGNCPEDSIIGLENMLDNIKVIADNPGINLLFDKFKDKPAVIVATGPSLKKNMHLLKGLEDKALIISCDASFKLLMENGIKPHLVTSLEREHEVQQFFDKFDPEEVKDVYMSACPVLFNHVYESYTGPKIIVYRNFDHFKWLGIDRGILDIKLSSSNMAFKIAEALGCNPIILVGQDLAYGPDGETHATKVPFSAEGEGQFEVKGNVTEKILTNTGWYGFLRAYEVDVKQFKGAVINCTEGGAFIQGTQIATLQETITNLQPFDPLKIIQENLKAPDQNDTEHLKGLIDKTVEDINCIINLCMAGAASCKLHEESLKGELTPERLTEIRQEIVQPRLDIQGKYTDTFQLFLMHVVQSVHLRFELECAMFCTDPKDVLLRFIGWYSFVGDICEICLQSLLKAKDKIYAV